MEFEPKGCEKVACSPSDFSIRFYQCDPVFIDIPWWIANADWAGAGYNGDAASLQRAAGTRIVPAYAEGCGTAAGVELRSAARGQVDGVDLAGFGETIITLDGSQLVMVVHFGEGQVSLEKL